MVAGPEGSAGSIKPVAPQGALAQELAEVAASATNLRRALAGANVLPDDFPRCDLDAVGGTLELTPGMSANGALDALSYARPKLSQLRRRWVAIEDSGGDLPDVQRGGAIDQAITRLIADVDTAREWYNEARKAAAEASDVAEDALAPAGSADLSALAARAHQTAEKARAIADELAEGATPGSVAADNLVRGVRDVEVLSRQEGIELSTPRPRLNLLDRLSRAVGRSAEYSTGALRLVEAGADFAKIGWERFSNVLTRQVSVLLEEVRDGAHQLRERIAHYEKEWAKEKENGRRPPRLPDLAIFRDIDAPWCPEMVVIPAGTFLMGSPEREEERYGDEGPQHKVTIGARFAIGRTPVTFDEYDHFCSATKREKPEDEGWGRGKRPVINVTWRDAVAYCEWLAKDTGQPYRLPSEAEWEYAARAGTTTRYAWSDAITPKNANYSESKLGKTTEVRAYPPNPWGLYDMHGNVWEWVEDVWHDSYMGAPTDGSAWTDREGIDSSRNRVYRGGSWGINPRLLRSANRLWNVPMYRNLYLGFRVARMLS